MLLNVTKEEYDAMLKLLDFCENTQPPPHNFDTTSWLEGLGSILGIPEGELQQRAGSFPGGELTKVNVVDHVDQRWV